ncbi:hypothetical protein NQ317_013744 [Molorchus minor]|uniref:Sarcalumenin n=1 Tax=Molorchus minor TaxID=1323400 RepID=A0ABQ9JC93_9CUCU|nr:hypothetical protein NQ317_013744 [Molorchus minor]
MEVCSRSSGLLLLLGLFLLAFTLQGVQGQVELEGPSESECRPFIEKALKELETGEPKESSETGDSREDVPTVEITTDDSDRTDDEDDNDISEDGNSKENGENATSENNSEQENAPSQSEEAPSQTEEAADDDKDNDTKEDDASEEQQDQQVEDDKKSEEIDGEQSKEESREDNGQDDKESVEQQGAEPETESKEDENDDTPQVESKEAEGEQDDSKEDKADTNEEDESKDEETASSKEEEGKDGDEGSDEGNDDANTEEDNSKEQLKTKDDSVEEQAAQTEGTESKEDDEPSKEDKGNSTEDKEDSKEETEDNKDDDEDGKDEGDSKEGDEDSAKSAEDGQSVENAEQETKGKEDDNESGSKENAADDESGENENNDEDNEPSEPAPEEELSVDIEIPTELRPRDQVEKLLKLDDQSSETETIINKVSAITLKELKKLYENAIKPLEVLYKYRDLSNRHFGDAEIFSKPLILFMGPWSGGKSSIINYLVNNEYNETSLRTGAEPSPAYFNILMYGDEPEIIDGTELAADFTFSGLQKFGQGLEERLRGVNIVEIPGILEVRKQVSRVFPFNDACQWFIDRADIIFLVYDPSKLDVGPETEAILDQLKGREPQTRIVLNKADQVKPEELMRVQGALIWNISPLMSSPQPPTMYTTSLWSRPYEPWAPVKLLQAQERAFLRDLRGSVDKRIENKIASARRFAVRVRNHAKMVDCYLTTYYNHKSVFGNRKQVADEIIENPQDYHIYEGLSTLTNISRYDLPDPDVYKDFFKGCPINRLDVAIAYDLPELVGTHKKLVESALTEAESQSTAAPGS